VATTAAPAADIRLLPGDLTLIGPHGSQRLLAVSLDKNGVVDGEVTGKVKFHSSNPAVVKVDEDGVARAVGDGQALLTALLGKDQTAIKVKVAGTKEPFTWSFRNHIVPVLTKIGCNSGACHGALAGKGGLKLSLRGYAPADDHFVLTRQANGRRIDPVEPANSLMLRKPTLAVPHGGGLKLPVESPEYSRLAEWIAAGGPGPKQDDVRITRLEVFPPAAILKPKDSLQMIVRAWYSDGHGEDVTRLARFASTEDQVAGVDDDGLVKVGGHGEAAITVLYSNLVAVAQIASPLPNQVDATIFAKSPRKSYIDDLVLKKLQSLNIPPSAECSDNEFIRRAYLDAAGILPTLAELQAFVKDKSADKRARLIDQLLARAEFVDYWTYKWSDVLLISSRKLPQPAMWAFYQHVRQCVADNKPWDVFARDILTAIGSNLQNGAANYFVMHKEVTDLTEATSVTFMGMSITCCRCHNHPLEKWTQDQYWSMANLFARVGIKNGDRAGEITVQSLPDGEALHLRRQIAMPPAPLDGMALALDSPVDRRKYFADWLTAKNNPYFARALVNRVWKNFMGRGLVEAEDDLRQTNPPSNPELLEALAKDFEGHNYDVKYLIKTIMNSAAYQRSAKPVPGNAGDDRFYSHYLIRRLPAEVVLDAYSQVTGVPTVFNVINVGASGGTAPTNAYPLGTRALQLPDALVASQFLDAFGRPDRSQTCSCERTTDATVGQALHLNNGKTLNDKLRSKASRVEQFHMDKLSDEEAIRQVLLLALSREPTAKELVRLQTLMADAARNAVPRREILEDLFWAVLTGKEFLFNH
jgi:hypothetical protein